MGVILGGKKLILEGGKAYNKFMYKDTLLEKKNASIDSKLSKVNAKIEQKAEDKFARKEEKRKMKEIPSNRKFEFHVPAFFKRDSEVEDCDENTIYFYDKDENPYSGEIIKVDSLLDSNFKVINPALKGRDLLSRDYEKDLIYIKDEKSNMLRVQSARKVTCDNQDEDERFVLLETEYQYFIVRFEIQVIY